MHSYFIPLIQQVTKDTKKPRERHPEHWLILAMEPRGEELPSCPAWQEPPHPGTALGTYPGSVLGAASSLRSRLSPGWRSSLLSGAGPVRQRSDGAEAAPGVLLSPPGLCPWQPRAEQSRDPSARGHRLSCANLRPPA